jgi:hypothetical protein
MSRRGQRLPRDSGLKFTAAEKVVALANQQPPLKNFKTFDAAKNR